MDEIKRRDFLKIAFAGLAGLMTIILGGPLIGYIFEPFTQEKYRKFTKVTGFTSLPEEKVTYLSFERLTQDSFFYKRKSKGYG